MTEGFTERLAQIVDIEMFIQSKVAGAFTKSEPLKLDPCSTLDFDAFYEPRKDLQAQMSYLK